MEIKGKNIAVLGLSSTGWNIAKALIQAGAAVWGYGYLTDNQKIELGEQFKDISQNFIFEEIPESALTGYDLVIITSSATSNLFSAAEYARGQGVPVLSDLDFAFQLMKEPIIAITGTCGKTTVRDMVYKMLLEKGLKVHVLGGEHEHWADLLVNKIKYDYHLLELSSYRLKISSPIKPHIAVFTNLFPAHGDRHDGEFLAYAEAKAKIFANQTEDDYLVHEASAGNIRELIRQKTPAAKLIKFCLNSPIKPPGAYYQKGKIFWLGEAGEKETYSMTTRLKTRPTRILNLMAAICVAKLCGISSEQIKTAIEKVKPLPGRLKSVRKLDGVSYIDDSQSNNIGATSWALNTFTRPIIWIGGGRPEHGSGLNNLTTYLKGKAKVVILIGTHSKDLAKDLAGIEPIIHAGTLSKALEAAQKMAEPGDIVLFSPACAPDEQLGQIRHTTREEFNELVIKLQSIPTTMGKEQSKRGFTRI